MDYKEKYEQGLECIQEILCGAGDSIKTSILRKRLQPYFPELKESEDERIRKAIISCCIDHGSKYKHLGVSMDEMCAWLEKQGEQTHAELVHSEVTKTSDQEIFSKKFCADNVIAWLVVNICDFEYYVKQFKKDFGL